MPDRKPTVEGIDRGVPLSNGAFMLQGGDIEGVTAQLVEARHTLRHHLSGRQGDEVHNKLNLHATRMI
jgi:hypothetical protein